VKDLEDLIAKFGKDARGYPDVIGHFAKLHVYQLAELGPIICPMP
jgi:hypothetical protein